MSTIHRGDAPHINDSRSRQLSISMKQRVIYKESSEADTSTIHGVDNSPYQWSRELNLKKVQKPTSCTNNTGSRQLPDWFSVESI